MNSLFFNSLLFVDKKFFSVIKGCFVLLLSVLRRSAKTSDEGDQASGLDHHVSRDLLRQSTDASPLDQVPDSCGVATGKKAR